MGNMERLLSFILYSRWSKGQVNVVESFLDRELVRQVEQMEWPQTGISLGMLSSKEYFRWHWSQENLGNDFSMLCSCESFEFKECFHNIGNPQYK